MEIEEANIIEESELEREHDSVGEFEEAIVLLAELEALQVQREDRRRSFYSQSEQIAEYKYRGLICKY